MHLWSIGGGRGWLVSDALGWNDLVLLHVPLMSPQQASPGYFSWWQSEKGKRTTQVPPQDSICVVFVPLAHVKSPGPESKWKATSKGLEYTEMQKMGPFMQFIYYAYK